MCAMSKKQDWLSDWPFVISLSFMAIVVFAIVGTYVYHIQSKPATQITQTQQPNVTMELFDPYNDFVIANEPMLGLSSTHINIITVVRKRDGKIFYALGGDHPDQFKEPYLRGRAIRLLKITGIEIPVIAY